MKRCREGRRRRRGKKVRREEEEEEEEEEEQEEGRTFLVALLKIHKALCLLTKDTRLSLSLSLSLSLFLHPRATLRTPPRGGVLCFIAGNKIIGCTFLALAARLFLASTCSSAATLTTTTTRRNRHTTRHGCAHTPGESSLGFFCGPRVLKSAPRLSPTRSPAESSAQRGRLIC